MEGTFRIGEWLVEPQLNRIVCGEQTAQVEPKIMQVLVCLAAHAGEVVPKERLISAVWNGTFVTDDVLTRSISELRKIFGDDAKEPRVIETIPRSGYRLIAPLRREEIKPGIDWQAAPATQWPPSPGWWIIAVGIVVSLAGVWAFWLRAPVPPPKVISSAAITNDGLQKAKHAAPSGFFSLATDGTRIYFTELNGSPWAVMQVPAAGGETVAIRTPFQKTMLFDLSSDGSKLLVGNWETLETEDPIWVVPATGGPSYRLGDLLAHDAAWSPAGDMLAYANGPDLYLAQSDGTHPRHLATVDGQPAWIRWSPDRERLRFTVQNRSLYTSSLWEIRADGTNLRALLPGWNESSSACCGNWTADGKYYVFQATLDNATNIWAIGEKRSFLEKRHPEPVQLTTGPMNFSRPLPSRDGTKLFVMGELQRGELVRYDSTSGQFVNTLSGISAEQCDFTRDGQWVTYIAYPDCTLWRSKIDGSQRMPLSLSPMIAALPHWSPDGERIAFMARTPRGNWKINIVSSAGGAPEQLMQGEMNESDPTWSPDGDQLAFGNNSSSEERASATRDIRLVNISTGGVSKLPGSEGKFSPRWSPDGRYIAALSSDEKELLLFDVKTSRWSRLIRAEATGAVTIGWPHWSRDARYVYYESWGADPAVFRIRVSSDELERVASLKDIRILIGVFGPWMGFAPDDSPMLLRHIGSQEIYALDWTAP